jgi:thioredoxin reductase (NADPH)
MDETDASPVATTDAIIIGAGPVGLYQAFQLGLLEVKCHLIDAWPEVGGQPVALYPDKPIYDIPALPVCSGRELAQRLLTQIQPFAVPMHLGHQVESLQRVENGQWQIQTHNGLRLESQIIIIAAGVGAFQAKKLAVSGVSDLQAQGRWCYHPAPIGAAPTINPSHVLVLGGDEEAIDDVLAWAALEQGPASIALLHRRSVLNASPTKLEALNAFIKSGRVCFYVGQITAIFDDTVTIEPPEGDIYTIPFDMGRAFLGLSPKLGPISEWGLSMSRKQLQVDPHTMATNAAGIFAVGDVSTYPGKKKLLVCGFHETVMAAFAAAGLIHPQRPPLLEYTTSSSRLHSLLGIF